VYVLIKQLVKVGIIAQL